MDSEGLRNFFVVVSVFIAFFGPVISFTRIKRRPEYNRLIESGQRLNLNAATMIPAFYRKADDPLRDAHIKIARIGLLHLAAMISGFFIFPTLVVGTFWVAGIR